MAKVSPGSESRQGVQADEARALSPQRVLEVGTAFMAAKTLLSAVELDLFTVLANQPLTGEALRQVLGLHPRANPDFFDTLVALGFLARDGNGPGALYRNTPETAAFLDRTQPGYIGGILVVANQRFYHSWGNLTAGLRTGMQQNDLKGSDKPLFDALYSDPDRMADFLEGMSGSSKMNFLALAEAYDFSRHRLLCDVGGALGLLATTVAQRHPQLNCLTVDIAPVTSAAEIHITRVGLEDRIKAVTLDMFTEPLPRCDVLTMSQILHDWSLEKKKQLIAKAFEALEPGGAFIAVEYLIDDERRRNAMGLLVSLTMLLETGEGFDYTAADFFGWCEEAGFRRGFVIPLTPGSSAAVVFKPEK